MARSDGRFPAYDRLDLDPESAPPGWDHGALRCEKCDTRWPRMEWFAPSVCCDYRVREEKKHAPDHFTGERRWVRPDMGWREAARRLLEKRFEALYEVWNEGASDIELAHEVPAGEVDRFLSGLR